MGGKKRRFDSEKPAGSDISRRKFVAGSLLLVGGSSMLVDGKTTATFRDSLSASGTVAVDGNPTLNYQIQDESKNNNAEYQIVFQVKWVANFDRIEIDVENQDAQHIAGDTFTRSTLEGSISYPGGGNTDGGAAGDSYQFSFRVYEEGLSDPVIAEQTTDTADGSGSGEGDFGDANSPQLESFYVTDETLNNNTNYTVEYEVSNTEEFQEVVITFDDAQNNWADAARTSTSAPTGSVSYSHGGTEGHEYEITVDVKNQNGITVDSGSVVDVANGDDSEWPP